MNFDQQIIAKTEWNRIIFETAYYGR